MSKDSCLRCGHSDHGASHHDCPMCGNRFGVLCTPAGASGRVSPRLPEVLLDEVARRLFALANDCVRYIGGGYERGIAVELRALHALLPKHLHPSDCDGCFAADMATDAIDEAEGGHELDVVGEAGGGNQ